MAKTLINILCSPELAKAIVSSIMNDATIELNGVLENKYIPHTRALTNDFCLDARIGIDEWNKSSEKIIKSNQSAKYGSLTEKFSYSNAETIITQLKNGKECISFTIWSQTV